MFETKYLIMIGAVVCLLILYYFYDEISNVKKSFIPTYQKTMALEAKLAELEKKTNDFLPLSKKKSIPAYESPVFSVSYNSDAIKNGNLSAKYIDLSETEAKKIIKNIEQHKQLTKSQLTKSQLTKSPIKSNFSPAFSDTSDAPLKSSPVKSLPKISPKISPTISPSILPVQKIFNVQSGDLSDHSTNKAEISDNNIFEENSETITIKISDLMSKPAITFNSDYSKILSGLTNDLTNGLTGESIAIPSLTCRSADKVFDNDVIDKDILKSISLSIQHESDNLNSLSDLSDVDPKISKKTGTKLQKKPNLKNTKNIPNGQKKTINK